MPQCFQSSKIQNKSLGCVLTCKLSQISAQVMSQWEVVECGCQATEPNLVLIPLKNLIINSSRISRLSYPYLCYFGYWQFFNEQKDKEFSSLKKIDQLNFIQEGENDQRSIRLITTYNLKFLGQMIQYMAIFLGWTAVMFQFLIADLCFYNMGCGHQVGCLGPKPREREVYLDLIDKIYNEVATITIDKKQEKYTSIKNHLLKKGLLRKLIDNLVSHKANLQQCLLQNLEMAESSKDSHGRVTSLIIVDKIFDQMFKTQNNTKPQSNQSMVLRSTRNIQQQRQSRELTSKNSETLQNVFMVTSIYMKLVLFLFLNDKDLYRDTSNSLKKVLSSNIEKLIWKGQIQSLFNFFIEKIKKHQDKEINIELATMILKKVKENLFRSIYPDTVEFLIKEFVNDQVVVSLSIFLPILKEYFKNVQGEYQILYEAIMKVLDQAQFYPTKSERISQLLNYFQLEAQGSKIFKKGLFNQLLNYLQIQFDNKELNKTRMKNYKNEDCKLNGFKLLTKWITEGNIQIDSIVECNPSALTRPYLLNIQRKSQDSFKKQLQHELFQYISLLKQSSVIITINKICEQFSQREVSNQKRQFLLKLITKLCGQKDNLIRKFSSQQFCKCTFLINIQNYYNRELKLQLLQFAILSFKRMNLKDIKQNMETNNLFMMKICEFLHSVWQEIKTSIKLSNHEVDEQLSPRLKQKNQMSNYIFIGKFISKFQCFLALMNQFGLNAALLGFMYRINSYLEDNDPFQSQEEALVFFIIQFFIQKTSSLLSKNILIPQPILRISESIEQNHVNEDLRHQMIESAKTMIKTELSKVQLGEYDALQPASQKDQIAFFMNKNKSNIQNLQCLCNISQEQIIHVDQTFKYYFSAPLRQKKKEVNQNFPSTVFGRLPSINLSLEQILNEKMSPRNQAQESFMEIIQKMQKE